MKISSSFILLALFSFLNINTITAQSTAIQIYPKVQELTRTGSAIDFHGFQLKKDSKWNTLVQRTKVGEWLTSSQKALPLKIALKKEIAAWKDKNNLTKAKGAYDLKVSSKQVTLAARDSVGIFYGLQTLRQLVKNQKIYPVNILDFPTVKYRGVVEGFYGTPWSQADRISQIKFYGTIKANTYIYGPKDDPYHSSPNWRKPYPPKQAENIKKLVQIANANFVHFVWAIHPGQDIKWNKEDRNNVLNKFEDMYDLGVRSFALFFDDISGEGTDANKQAELLNYLTDHFVKVKKGVNPLILTPTEYNKGWANPGPNGYLSILGKKLDPSVQVMWTGDHVMSDVTKSTLAWVQKRIQRPALVWWNFPVSDYARNNLFIGPSYGLEKGITGQEMAGILSNPMEHAEASKPAIFGVADYGWNTATYQPEKSWIHCLKILLPHSYKAYKLFGENNSNPRHGITSYIGKESKDIAPYLERLKKGIKTQEVKKKDMIFTEGYFFNIEKAANKIIKADDDSMLLSEVIPWLHNFTELGEEGLNQLENYKYHTLSPASYWNHIISRLEKSNYWTPQSFKAGDGHKTTAITGPRVLRPFVQFLWHWNSQKLFEKIIGTDQVEKQNLVLGKIHTNINLLKDSKISVENKTEIYIQPQQKSFQLGTDKYFTVELSETLKGADVILKYKSKKSQDLQIEVSKTGSQWQQVEQSQHKETLKANINQGFQFIRISNKTANAPALKLAKLTIKKKGISPGAQPFTTRDFNLLTAYSLQPGQTLTEKSKLIKHPNKVIILTNSANTKLQIKVKKATAWETLPQTFEGKYISVTLPKGTSEIQLSGNQTIKIYEVLWK